jgi:hypothetical protein
MLKRFYWLPIYLPQAGLRGSYKFNQNTQRPEDTPPFWLWVVWLWSRWVWFSVAVQVCMVRGHKGITGQPGDLVSCDRCNLIQEV